MEKSAGEGPSDGQGSRAPGVQQATGGIPTKRGYRVFSLDKRPLHDPTHHLLPKEELQATWRLHSKTKTQIVLTGVLTGTIKGGKAATRAAQQQKEVARRGS